MAALGDVAPFGAPETIRLPFVTPGLLSHIHGNVDLALEYTDMGEYANAGLEYQELDTGMNLEGRLEVTPAVKAIIDGMTYPARKAAQLTHEVFRVGDPVYAVPRALRKAITTFDFKWPPAGTKERVAFDVLQVEAAIEEAEVNGDPNVSVVGVSRYGVVTVPAENDMDAAV